MVISKIVFKDMSVTWVQYWAVLPLLIPMITNTNSGVVLIAKYFVNTAFLGCHTHFSHIAASPKNANDNTD